MTIIVQIGNSDNKLTQVNWSEYVADVHIVLSHYEMHFSGGSGADAPWQNYAWVVVCDLINLDILKNNLTVIRKRYEQDSIAITKGETKFI